MDELKVYIIKAAGKVEMNRGMKWYSRIEKITLPYLAALCPDFCEVRLCDEVYQKVDYDWDADVVALTADTHAAKHAFEIAGRFKVDKGAWTLIGGPHATVRPVECLEHMDSVCVGEAENQFPRFLQDVQQNRKPRRLYRNGKPADLTNLPAPRWDLLKHRLLSLPGVQTTRGCVNNCEFCFIRHLYGKGVRARPVDDVIEEIQRLKGSHFMFWDDNIISDRAHAIELFTKLIPLKKKWFSQCCLSITDDDELLRLASRSGCASLLIGFETFHQESLNALKKGFYRRERFKSQIDKLHDHGIMVFSTLMFGSDGDDPSIFERNLEAVDYLQIDIVASSIVTPHPGTDLHNRLIKEKRIFDLNWDHYNHCHVVFQPRKMTADQLQEGYTTFYKELYSLPRIGKRLRREVSLSTPFYYFLALNDTYRAYARLAAEESRTGPMHTVQATAA